MGGISDFFSSHGIACEEELPLSSRSSFKTGGRAAIAVFPSTESELITAIEVLKAGGYKIFVAGGLSNTLIPDSGYSGAVIFTDSIKLYRVDSEAVEFSCGVRLSHIFDELCKMGVSAFEPFYGIPGLVGGLIYNNAGAFSAEISDIFLSARIYDMKSGKIELVNRDKMEFSYRSSILKKNKDLILLSATFSYKLSSSESIRSAVRELSEIRRKNQPLSLPSLGSVFKRPGVGYAGEWIEKAGLKGFSVGGAVISEKHAGFIVNDGTATSEDFIAVMNHAEMTVLEMHGIRLEKEIEILE